MSDCIVDIDEELLGLFEDHDEVIYLSFLSIINSLTSIRLIKNNKLSYYCGIRMRKVLD